MFAFVVVHAIILSIFKHASPLTFIYNYNIGLYPSAATETPRLIIWSQNYCLKIGLYIFLYDVYS